MVGHVFATCVVKYLLPELGDVRMGNSKTIFYIESNAEPVLWCASDVAGGDKWLAHDWHNANMAINILSILYCTPAVSIN